MLALALAAAYLFVSFPTGVVLSRFVVGDDIRGHGSGNTGASNVARTFGVMMGSMVGLLDILKGLLPILIGRWLGLCAVGSPLTVNSICTTAPLLDVGAGALGRR